MLNVCAVCDAMRRIQVRCCVAWLSGCSEQQTRFYAVQVALGLEYMQYMDLVYRDLKPENILINVNGYLKVAVTSAYCVFRNKTRMAVIAASPSAEVRRYHNTISGQV